MPFNIKTSGSLALAMLGATNAHMIMKSPIPFDVANINNSPLAADGSDFPCKVDAAMSAYSYKITAMNEMPVDKPILLSFDGSAVHGGGACQLSITFDEKPTKQSVFKVIQTFEGGECPKPTGPGLTFNIPKDFPNAENATLAWTWFNRIGNREMYMNCAPISITGGSDSKDYYESLPDMLVANVATTDCKTDDSTDAQVPNPGAFVLQATDLKLAALKGDKCPAEVQTTNAKSGKATNLASFSPPDTDYNKIIPVADGGDSGGASPSLPAVDGGGNDGMYTAPAAAPAQPSSTAATPNNGLYSQPAAEAAPSSPSSAASSAPAPTASAAAASPYSTFQTMTIPSSSSTQASAAPPAYPTLSPSMGQGISGPSSGGSTASPTGYFSGSSSSDGVAGSPTTCNTEGAIVCNGSDQFGLCDHGNVVWQKVSSGTTCSNGSIQRRSAHVRRHAHGAYRLHDS
jgi:hypothetical protein